MADKNISDLPAAAPLDGSELIEILQGGVNKKVSVTTLHSFAGGGGGGGGGLTQLSTPASFAAGTPGTTSIPYSWADVSNESSYVLEVATDSGFSSIIATLTPAANATAATVTGLTPSTTYYARLRAIGDGVTYSNSNNTSTVTASTAATTFNILTEPTVLAVYDVTDASKVTKDGSNLVAQLDDSTSNGKHLVQPTGGNKPLYVGTGGANNSPHITFADGKFLLNGSFTHAQPYHLYLVVKQNSLIDNSNILQFDGYTNAIAQKADNAGIYFDSVTPVCDGSWSMAQSNKNSYITAYSLFHFKLSGGASTMEIMNELPYETANGLGSPGGAGFAKMQIGADGGVGASFEFVYAAIFSGAPTDTLDQNVKNFLMTKFAFSNFDYIAYFGDSVTVGFYATDQTRLGYATLTAFEKGKHKYNYAVSSTSFDALPGVIPFALGKGTNGWVVINFGTNAPPSGSQGYLDNAIQALIDEGYNPAKILVCVPHYQASRVTQLNVTVRGIVQNTCTAKGCTLVDMYAHTKTMADAGAFTDTANADGTTDGTHPGDQLHRALADYLKTFIS